jgi:hypothetical protein
MTNSRPASGIVRCALALAGVVAFTFMVPAQPAAASNLTATNGRSSIVSIEATNGHGDVSGNEFLVSVIGGDAALRVVATPGHEVIVLGYAAEPYLRISTDGSTSVNTRSPATALNQTRNGGTEEGTADASAEPEWLSLEGSSEVVWHDHRIHSMTAADSGHEWSISLLVDGNPVTTNGELRLEPPPLIVPWVLLIGAVSAVAVLGGRRRPTSAALVTAGVAASISLVLAALVTVATPTELGRDLLPVVVTIAAWLTCVIGSLTPHRMRIGFTIASAALSAGFLATMLRNLSCAIPVPILGPPIIDRVAVSIAVAAVIATFTLAVIGAGQPLPPADSANFNTPMGA